MAATIVNMTIVTQAVKVSIVTLSVNIIRDTLNVNLPEHPDLHVSLRLSEVIFHVHCQNSADDPSQKDKSQIPSIKMRPSSSQPLTGIL